MADGNNIYLRRCGGIARHLRRSLGKGVVMAMACTLLCAAPAAELCAQTQKKKSPAAKAAPAPAKKKTGQQTAAKKGGAAQGSKKGSAAPATKKGGGAKQPTADELKRQQQSAQAEVKKTQEELRKNEAEVKRNLSELTKLEDDIAVSKKESTALSAEVGKLAGRIGDLETKISAQTKELERLRSEYLKAVKKMRVSRKRNSGMSYLFSAKDLAQAERRMRYLKEFSEWKDRQTKDIQAKVAELEKANAELKRAKSDKDVMLGRELKVQSKLSEQKQRQSVVVAELKANGEALQSHLAKKQAEVNALKNQVAAVIAEEQRKAEAERRKREEAARAEQERLARQKAAEEAARADREAKEAAAREAAREKAEKEVGEEAEKQQASKEQAKKETPKSEPKKDSGKKETPKKEQPKKETAKKEPSKKDSGKEAESGDYAKARKRKPRGEASDKSKKETAKQDRKKDAPKSEPKKEEPKKESPKGNDFGNFAAAKGSLPRPVSGAWRVTGKFGRHALPDLPDVIYDNPGIDVEVSKGATVKSVFGGEVSGVYMVPGFATVIIVSHGDYYTVYGNISKASVKVGDKVKQGQALGSASEDPDNPGHGTLHFEVWKGREKLNPQSWIQ